MKRRKPLLVLSAMILTLAALMTMPVNAFAATPMGTKPQPQAPSFLHLSGTRANVNPATVSNMTYRGGSVMGGTTNVYAIFWEPFGRVSANYNFLITRYFNDVGGQPLYNNNAQYPDSTHVAPLNTVLAGVWDDITSYPETPLLDRDIQQEVRTAQSVNGWSSSVHNVFFVFLDRGQDLCKDSSRTHCASTPFPNGFCGYHGAFGSTIYAALPYDASFSCNPGSSPNHDDADWTINVTSHEQMESATDPFGNAWFDSGGQEIGDKCNFVFGTRDSFGGDVNWGGDEYIVQKEWDNVVSGCVLVGP